MKIRKPRLEVSFKTKTEKKKVLMAAKKSKLSASAYIRAKILKGL